VAVIAVIVMAVAVTHTRSKSDLTELTNAMFVDRSSFPDIDGAKWVSADVQTNQWSPPAADPPDCSPLMWGPRASQVGSAFVSREGNPSLTVTLYLADERPDFVMLLSRCQAVFTKANGQMVYKPRHIAGLPGGVASFQDEQDEFLSLGVKTMYRGICISVILAHSGHAEFAPADEHSLATVFKNQMAKLQSA
jgi:hypothetical protein